MMMMDTVTSRCRKVRCPGQYITIKQFSKEKFYPTDKLKSNNSYGLVVDYLTRFYLGATPEKAFSISLKGALLEGKLNPDNNQDPYTFAKAQCKRLNPEIADQDTINAAFNLVQFDSVYRTGIAKPIWLSDVIGQTYDFYIESPFPKPSDFVTENVIKLLKRSLTFFKGSRNIITELNFDLTAFTQVIAKGDGDLIADNTLWDLKCYSQRLSPVWALQVLVYYILGMHSSADYYHKIKYIGIFNPCSNIAYRLAVKNISNKVKYKVSNQVIGYHMLSNNYDDWLLTYGTDEEILKSNVQANAYHNTGFDPKNYKDGIYDISFDDYITFVNSDYLQTNTAVPKLKNIKAIKFLKHNKFMMFIAINPNNRLLILYGGKKVTLPHKSIKYYYDYLPMYGKRVLEIFSRYWDFLYDFANKIKKLSLDEDMVREDYMNVVKEAKKVYPTYDEFKQSPEYEHNGRVHGNIVDVDFWRHFYINPLDGTIHAYTASSITDKNFYKTIESFFKNEKPALLAGYKEMLKTNPPLLLSKPFKQKQITSNNSKKLSSHNKKLALVVGSKKTVHVSSTSMYTQGSNELRGLQYTYDSRLVVIWDNDIFATLIDKLTEK